MKSQDNPAIYFKSIGLKNVRCFGNTKQTIDFTDEEGDPCLWNIILGENGVGKTTVLRSLVLAAPNDSLNEIIRNIDFDIFRRNEENDPLFHYNISVQKSDGEKENYDFPIMIPTHMNIKPKPKGKETGFSALQSRLSINLPNVIKDLKYFGYGASRRIGESAITKEEEKFTAKSLFDDSANLINAEEWLITVDYQALSQPNSKWPIYRERVIKTLKHLLRDEVKEIKIETEGKRPKLKFETHYGWVELHQMSLGYKTLIAWMVDFASRLIDAYPDEENPLEQPAVVLVDEIDLHLHPKLQRSLTQFLSETFPRTQFIATAHSPLIVQAAQDANIILLKRSGQSVKVESNPENVKNWRVDQILTSELFDLKTARPPQVEKPLLERNKILAKKNITPKDEKRLKKLDQIIGELPVGETKEKMEAISAVDKIAAILSSSQSKGDQN